MVIDISHLAFMMLLMVFGVLFMIKKTGWLVGK